MLQNIEHTKGGARMKSATRDSNEIKKAKQKLGKMIRKLREKQEFSLRELARAVGLPPSNMKYIEDGVNAPSPDKYLDIIRYLSPDSKKRDELDTTYSIIRGTPPPDVCNIICNNKGLNDVLRIIDSKTLSTNQIEQLKLLVKSFRTDIDKGEKDNG